QPRHQRGQRPRRGVDRRHVVRTEADEPRQVLKPIPQVRLQTPLVELDHAFLRLGIKDSFVRYSERIHFQYNRGKGPRGNACMFSEKVEYALRAVTYLASQAPAALTVEQIAEVTKVKGPAYLAKVVQELVRAGILTSQRGVKGGISLARRPEDVT